MRRFTSLRFGVDYFASILNTFSISQNLVRGRFSTEEEQDQEYLKRNEVMECKGLRLSESNNGFNRYSTQFNYTHRFPKQGKQLSANLNYNASNGN